MFSMDCKSTFFFLERRIWLSGFGKMESVMFDEKFGLSFVVVLGIN